MTAPLARLVDRQRLCHTCPHMPPGPEITSKSPTDAVREWFAALNDYCESVDYVAARTIFASGVASFGTRADIVTGVEALRKNQWEGIWPNISDFKVDLSSVRGGGEGDIAWGMAVWSSTGFHEDGRPFDRPGRATVVLQRQETGCSGNRPWLAVHTHFSLNPGTPQRTYGRKR